MTATSASRQPSAARRRTPLAIAAAGISALLSLGMAGCEKPMPVVAQPVIGVITPPTLARQWKLPLDLNGDAVVALHVRDPYVFVYTKHARSYIIDRKAGTLVHVTDVFQGGRGEVIKAPAVLANAVVYPTAHTLEVYGRDGQHQRSIELQYPPRTQVATADPLVYIGADFERHGRLLVVDVGQANGSTQQVFTAGALSAGPAVNHGVFYVGAEDGRVYAGNADFTAAWPLPDGVFTTQGPIVGDLFADDAGVYVASTDTELYCLNPKNGALQWRYYAGTPLRTGPTATADLVYQFVPTLGLAAIDKQQSASAKANGDPIRQARWVDTEATRFLAEDDRFAYVLGPNNRIDALDKQTGGRQFSSVRTDFAFVGTTLNDGVVYASTADGVVFAIKPVTNSGVVGEIVMNPVPQAAVASAR